MWMPEIGGCHKNCRKRNQFSERNMANINQVGDAVADANLENAENRIEQVLPYDLLGACAVSFYILLPPTSETTELQMLIGISYRTGLCFALLLAYPIYRVLTLEMISGDRFRGWAFELTHWNCLTYESYVLCVYVAFSLSKFLHIPFAILAGFFFYCIGEFNFPTIANTENRFSQWLRPRQRLEQFLLNQPLNACTGALYLLYPALKDTAELQQSLIGISYSTGLCFALGLAYPIYRLIPLLNNHWRGWAFELTHWNLLEYECFVLRFYATFSLPLFLRMPLVSFYLNLNVSVLFARLPLRYRIGSVMLVFSIAYFWWYDFLTSGSLYELRNLSWIGSLLSILVFACSINNAVELIRPIH